MGTAAGSSEKGRQTEMEIAMRKVVIGLLLGMVLFLQTGCFEVVVQERSDGRSYTSDGWWYAPGYDCDDCEDEWVEEWYFDDYSDEWYCEDCDDWYYDEPYDRWYYDEWYDQWYYDEWYYDQGYDGWYYDAWYDAWYYWF